MPIHITMNHAATKAANYLLSHQNMSAERANQILPATKYNLLVKGFNASTLLLTAAAVSALFLALSTSFVFLCLGLFLRYATEQELNLSTIPIPPTGAWEGNAELIHANILRFALHQLTDEEKITNIFQRVALPRVEGWEPNEVLFLDFAAWKNTLEIPGVIELQPQQQPLPAAQPVVAAVEAAEEPPPAQPAVAAQNGWLGNIIRMVYQAPPA